MALWQTERPTRCGLCADWNTQPLCAACVAQYAPLKPRCQRCGLGVPAGVSCCGACLLSPPPFVQTIVAVDYRPPWTHLIQRLKFQEACEWARPLATLLAQAVKAQAASTDMLLPLPLHEHRLRQRGFNQSGLLADALGRALGLPVGTAALLRWRDTGHQAALDRQTRLHNLQGAFMPHPVQGHLLRGRHVALVDDVMTTGATCRAATLAALEGGAASVSLWLLARTPAPDQAA
ncbi:MAG: hypothetical protein C4K60_10320 [Ideonella sp. MAG2]|nr:MAG: hypothetical protein C4K60_10320 [Ideonella sp. MAG2]